MEIEEKELIKHVEDKLATADKSNYDRQGYLNIAYFIGKQWIAYDQNNKRLFEPPKESWQVRFVGNKIQPIVRTELAKMVKNKPNTMVIPASSEDKDIKSARVGDKVLDWIWYELKLQKLNRKLGRWGLVYMGFVKPFWNPNKGQEIPDPKTGEVIKQGDIDAIIVSPFELKWDPIATEWTEVKWICHEKARDVDYIEQVYGKKVSPEKGLLETNLFEKMLKDSTVLGQGITYKQADKSAVVKEYWELPSKDYPKGRRVTIANGVLLFYDEDIGFGEEDDTERELPFFPFFHIDVPGRIIPTTVVEQLIPIQREYNKTRSQIIENQNLMSNPCWTVEENSLVTEINAGQPGQVIIYKKGYQKPQMEQPASLGVDVYKNLEKCDEEFEFVSGQHETSHGSAPAGVKSGVAISFLQEQDDTKLGPTIENFEDCIEDYTSYLLKMLRYKYDIPRTLKIVGKDKKIETFDFQGSDLTSTDVRVIGGSALPQSKAAKQEWVMNLIQNRVLDPAKDRNLILKMLELGITDDLYDDYAMDINHAQSEQEKWVKGDFTAIVRDFYNHEIHIMEHNKFRKSDDYNELPPEAQEAIDAHVAEHENYIMQSVAPPVDPKEQILSQLSPEQQQMYAKMPPEEQDAMLQEAMKQ